MENVAYLENHDFDENGNLIADGVPTNVPAIIMVQSTWCPHCKKAKPAFEKFAKLHKDKAFAATIEVDGERPSEKALGKRLSTLKPDLKGFPDYLMYYNGTRVNAKVPGRDVQDLVDFSEMADQVP